MEKNILTETRKQILKSLIGETPERMAVFASWGADPASLRNTLFGISFRVNGFLHQGQVNVWKDFINGGFVVELLKNGEVTTTERVNEISDLQKTVDYLVEYDPERYESMLEAEAEKDPIFGLILNVKRNGGAVVLV